MYSLVWLPRWRRLLNGAAVWDDRLNRFCSRFQEDGAVLDGVSNAIRFSSVLMTKGEDVGADLEGDGVWKLFRFSRLAVTTSVGWRSVELRKGGSSKPKRSPCATGTSFAASKSTKSDSSPLPVSWVWSLSDSASPESSLSSEESRSKLACWKGVGGWTVVKRLGDCVGVVYTRAVTAATCDSSNATFLTDARVTGAV